MRSLPRLFGAAVAAFWLIGAQAAVAQNCPVSHDQLAKALKASVKPSGGPGNGGFDNNEWGVVVDGNGTVCAVAMSGDKPDDQWLASRAIAAEKANTANAMSLQKMALSTANLYAGSLPGGYLYGRAGQQSDRPEPGLRRRSEHLRQRQGPACRQASRRRHRVRRRARALRRTGQSRGDRRQRRHLLRRSQHRLAGAPGARSRPCAERGQPGA